MPGLAEIVETESTEACAAGLTRERASSAFGKATESAELAPRPVRWRLIRATFHVKHWRLGQV